MYSNLKSDIENDPRKKFRILSLTRNFGNKSAKPWKRIGKLIGGF